jgi:Tol biopolymer transport system component
MGNLEFSPDGSRIAYLALQRESCKIDDMLFVLEAGGDNLRRIFPKEMTVPPEAEETAKYWYGIATIIPSFAWSPASDAIAASFIKTDTCKEGSPANAQTYLFKLNDLSEKKIADEAAHNLTWSPRGDLLAYETESPGGPQIRLLNVNTGEVRNLGRGTNPSWKPRP